MCTRTRALDVRPPKWYQEDRGADASLVGQANFDRKKQVAPGSRSHFRSFLEPAGRGWGGGHEPCCSSQLEKSLRFAIQSPG